MGGFRLCCHDPSEKNAGSSTSAKKVTPATSGTEASRRDRLVAESGEQIGLHPVLGQALFHVGRVMAGRDFARRTSNKAFMAYLPIS
jgi:hypothetical protein